MELYDVILEYLVHNINAMITVWNLIHLIYHISYDELQMGLAYGLLLFLMRTSKGTPRPEPGGL